MPYSVAFYCGLEPPNRALPQPCLPPALRQPREVDGSCFVTPIHCTQPGTSLPEWRSISRRVRARQPQLVMSGEGYGSWAQIIESDANLGGQGHQGYHVAMRRAVEEGDASGLEPVSSTSGSDAATVVCYLHPAYDGEQPGGCPTMYFRDVGETMADPRRHTLWVALEAGSGIVSQHDFDPGSTCAG